MKRSKSIKVPVLVLSLAVLLFVAGFWGMYTSEGSVKARERDERLASAQDSGPVSVGPTLEVSVVRAELAVSAEIVELAGQLEPVRSTWVASELAGRIVDVPAREHAPIEKGGELVRLDSSLPRAELIRSKASHAFAKTELERQQRLGRSSVASQAELERAAAEERRSYAALLEARARLDYTRIRAPFDGLVNQLDHDPGAYVQPGTRIAEVLDVSRIEVTVLVSDRQVSALEPGATARIRIDALGSERFEGRIARVARATQEASQRYPIVIELDNAEGRFLPGMLAYVQLAVGTAHAIRLPARALLHEFELDYVFTLDENDVARRVRVSTRPVPFRPDQFEVHDGLSEGARVVVTAVSQLRDGLRVRVR